MGGFCEGNTSASAGGEFCEQIQVGIDAHIPYHKYQAQDKPFLWFPAVCAAVVAHENCFLCFCQQNKYSASKLKFRQGDNYYKRIPEAFNLACTNK